VRREGTIARWTQSGNHCGGQIHASARALARIAVTAALLTVVLEPWALRRSFFTATNPKHFLLGTRPVADGTVNSPHHDLIYHGGNLATARSAVETKPACISSMGAEWATGFTTPDRHGRSTLGKTLQNYVNSFHGERGGSRGRRAAQYCERPAGTDELRRASGADYVTNPKKQLKGRLDDPTPVPDDIITLGSPRIS